MKRVIFRAPIILFVFLAAVELLCQHGVFDGDPTVVSSFMHLSCARSCRRDLVVIIVMVCDFVMWVVAAVLMSSYLWHMPAVDTCPSRSALPTPSLIVLWCVHTLVQICYYKVFKSVSTLKLGM